MKGVVTENDIDLMPVVAIQALYGQTKEKTKLNTTEAILQLICATPESVGACQSWEGKTLSLK